MLPHRLMLPVRLLGPKTIWFRSGNIKRLLAYILMRIRPASNAQHFTRVSSLSQWSLKAGITFDKIQGTQARCSDPASHGSGPWRDLYLVAWRQNEWQIFAWIAKPHNLESCPFCDDVYGITSSRCVSRPSDAAHLQGTRHLQWMSQLPGRRVIITEMSTKYR